MLPPNGKLSRLVYTEKDNEWKGEVGSRMFVQSGNNRNVKLCNAGFYSKRESVTVGSATRKEVVLVVVVVVVIASSRAYKISTASLNFAQ